MSTARGVGRAVNKRRTTFNDSWILAALFVWASCSAQALPPTGMVQLAGQSTFEVVIPKIEPAHVKYERALPFELLSFTERNDRFWSIGTAFAIAPNTFVSAAHVLQAGIGSGMGGPGIRDAQGRVFPVVRVLRHSAHEDFIVFSVRDPPEVKSLLANREPVIGATVFAVGNALGDGVVIRDGRLTSLTDEEQDGRWKWLRFSAATSPGNSGGPLLDEVGSVIGVITAKSPGENLNYALPIARVLDAPTGKSVADLRASFGLPMIRGQRVIQFRKEFPLPADWSTFVANLMRDQFEGYLEAQRALLDQEKAKLPPSGDFDRLAASLDAGVIHALVKQLDDDSWGLEEGTGEEETELPGEARLWLSSIGEAGLFRIRRPETDSGVDYYRDGTAQMDALLRGLKFTRTVGQQSIRITSLGAPQRETLHRDRFGRVWFERSWSLGYSDLEFLSLSLPTPEGFIGLLRFSSALNAQSIREDLRLTADYMHVAYKGTLQQWQAFVASPDLAPQLLRNTRLKHDKDKGLTLSMPGVDVRIDPSVIRVENLSPVTLLMAMGRTGDELAWSPLGVQVEEQDDEPSFVHVLGQVKPGMEAGSKLKERWDKLSQKKGDYSGEAQYSRQFDQFWTRSVVGSPGGERLYEVVLNLREKSLLPRDVTTRRDQLLAGIQLLEITP